MYESRYVQRLYVLRSRSYNVQELRDTVSYMYM